MLAASSLSGAAYAADDPAKAAEPAASQEAPKCPAPNTQASTSATRREVKAPAPLPEDVEFESDGAEGTRDGNLKLTGKVEIRQGERRIETRDATYNTQDESFDVTEGVKYTDGTVTVQGQGAHVDRAGGAVFDHAEFELADRNARGSADRIRATTEGTLSLDKVRYTTCPLGNEDWMLTASDIDINQRVGIGIGRGVRLDFKGVPLLYAPFISFPVGNERKSGFLFPTLGTSSRSGYSLSVPWYWNIATNYDATFTPTYFSKRGLKLDSEFRYLNRAGEGQLEVQYLPHDDKFESERSLIRFVDQSDFTSRLRLNVDAANVSDDEWFEDFGMGPEGTSVTYLNRSASLTYLDDRWLAIVRAQNFQTIDFATDNRMPIAPEDRPYTMLPQMAVRASFPDQPFGLTYGMDFELANFQHNVDTLNTGWRTDFAPEIRMPLRGAGVYLEPSASWRYTRYQLDRSVPITDSLGNTIRTDDTFTRSAPVMSVDGGMVFERLFGSRKQRLSTIEPRFMYLYVPYRNQDNLPVFDTELADLNLVQLFRTNRYVGGDRLGDANELAIGFTSRWLDANTGEQYIAATIGQAYYFDRPKVTLPGEVQNDTETSDIVAELDLRAYGNWNIRGGIQWDPGETRSERGQLALQYKPDFDRVMNLGYRFRRDRLEQVDGSVAWPVSKQWSVYARMVYSLEGDAIDDGSQSSSQTRVDEKGVIDQFLGLEYRSCCWRFRVVGRRYVSDRTGDLDTSVLFQLELNGLSNVGVGADTFLERSIRGYSIDSPKDE
ncbi:LPS-assembly protein LptD [Steroidobacter flavus]|uniref:LPS-assembly protein LptD n=1 Tax=Steroidobacter flavus TaxID=1842136 RepID=A0ABV8SM21_9GAMM